MSSIVSSNHQKYTSKNPGKRFLVARFKQRLLSLLKKYLRKNSLLLDAGCGEGFIAVAVKENFPQVEIIGVDKNKTALQLAKQKNPNIIYQQQNLRQLDFANNTFDATLCLEVLEHLSPREAEEVLLELLRVTKKTVIFSVPNEPFFSLANLVFLKNISRGGNDPGHLNRWTNRGFQCWLHQHQIKIQTSTTSFPWTIVVCKK